MSLRARLVLVVVLATIALAAAVTAIAHVVGSTDAARWATAEEGAGAIAATIASAVARGESEEVSAWAALGALTDADAGTCDAGGAVLAQAGLGKHAERRPKPLPPDLREAIARACASPEPVANIRLEHPGDFTAIAVRPASGDHRAWGIRRVPRLAALEQHNWHVDVVVLASATFALVGVTLGVALTLGRGVRDLEGSLEGLRTDLHAPVKVPRASELARVAGRVREMAIHLAEAQSRERRLARELAHGERLAALGRVAAGVAHEVRNPLAGIKLRLDVLDRSGELSPSAQDGVHTCLEEVARLDRVVGSLLQVAKKSASRPRTLDLREIVERRVALVSADAETKGVSVAIDGRAHAFADEDATARIVENLLRNAIDAAPEHGTVQIAIASGECASVTVVDQGPGVPPETEERLFEPFFTTKPEGTGLGLWMSRTLAETLGGALHYRREGDATRFVLELPAEEPNGKV